MSPGPMHRRNGRPANCPKAVPHLVTSNGRACGSIDWPVRWVVFYYCLVGLDRFGCGPLSYRGCSGLFSSPVLACGRTVMVGLRAGTVVGHAPKASGCAIFANRRSKQLSNVSARASGVGPIGCSKTKVGAGPQALPAGGSFYARSSRQESPSRA